MDQTQYYVTIFRLLPSSSHSSRGFCCLFRHRGSSQDVVFVLWLETKNGNTTFVNKVELKYPWHKSIYPLHYSTDLEAHFWFKETALQFDVVQTSWPNHKNFGIENTKVTSKNIQISTPDWKEACECRNIIILISKFFCLWWLVFNSQSCLWGKGRSFPSSIIYSVSFIPTKDLWHV